MPSTPRAFGRSWRTYCSVARRSGTRRAARWSESYRQRETRARRWSGRWKTEVHRRREPASGVVVHRDPRTTGRWCPQCPSSWCARPLRPSRSVGRLHPGVRNRAVAGAAATAATRSGTVRAWAGSPYASDADAAKYRYASVRDAARVGGARGPMPGKGHLWADSAVEDSDRRRVRTPRKSCRARILALRRRQTEPIFFFIFCFFFH